MAIRITDGEMISDLTGATAHFRARSTASGRGAWITSLRPDYPLDRHQAITALTIAEEEARLKPDRQLIADLENELPRVRRGTRSCPKCGETAPNIFWTGADGPAGPDYWYCRGCRQEWTTPALQDAP